MFGLGLQELLILVVIFGLFALVTWPFWKIFSRAGFSGWLSLTQLVPILNVVVSFYFAFAKWPIQEELNLMKQMSRENEG